MVLNKQQLISIIGILIATCNAQASSLSSDSISDEKFTEYLSILKLEGKIEIDPSTGHYIINSELFDILSNTKDFELKDTMSSSDCDEGGPVRPEK